jgi:hypothetical protein
MTNDTNEEVIIEPQETNEEVELELEEETPEVVEEDKPVEKPVETPEAKLARLKRQTAQLEKKLGVEKKVEKPVTTQTTSTRDLIALMDAKVPADDIGDVEDYAKYKGISLADALKTGVVKTMLAEKAEKRNTANATNTGNARRSPSKISDEALLDKARKGEIPESDEEITRLVKSRIGIK